MRTTKILVTGIAIATVALSCQMSTESTMKVAGQSEVTAGEMKDVSPMEFQKLIGENSIILDVRREVEYNSGHLEGAVNIDFFSDNFVEEVTKLDKNKTLLIYCASGGRSSTAMKKLEGKGFAIMYNMLGGFGSWRSNNLPFVQ